MHELDLKALGHVQSICDFLARFFGLLLALFVIRDINPAWQDIWALVILCLIGAWWLAQIGIWMISKAVSQE